MMPTKVQQLIIDFCQIATVNLTAFIITFASVENSLKILSLIVATGYTGWKWITEFKATKKRKNGK